MERLIASAPGRTLIASGMGGWFVLDPVDGRIIQRNKLETGGLRAPVLSPDGRTLAIGDESRRIQLWDLESGSLVRMLPDRYGADTPFPWSQDGTSLLCTGTDRKVRLWDATTGQLLWARAEHPGNLQDGGSCAGNGLIATADDKGKVCLWEIATGSVVQTFQAPDGGATALALSPDGKTLVTGGADLQVRLWDTTTGRVRDPLSCQTEHVAALAFSPDGKTLTSGGGWLKGFVRLWDPATGELRQTLHGHRAWVMALAYSPDGKILASGGSRDCAEVKLWDSRTGRLLRTLGPDAGFYRTLAFTPDGSRLAGGTLKQVRIWNCRTGELLQTLEAHNHWITGIAFSPDGRWMVTTSGDHRAKLWDARSGALVRMLDPGGCWLTSVAFSPDGRLLAIGDWDGNVILRETENWTERILAAGARQRVNTLAFSPDGKTLGVGTSEGHVQLWDPHTGTRLWGRALHKGMVYAVAFSPDGQRLASGGPDGAVNLWQARTGRLHASLVALPEGETGRPIKADSRPIKADSRPLEGASGGDDYLVLTPEGYYCGSVAADRFVRFRLQTRLFPAECFQAPFYRPDRVLQSLAGLPSPPPPPLKGPHPPTVRFITPEDGVPAPGKSIEVTLEADDDSGVARVELLVNGTRAATQAVPSAKPDPRPGTRPSHRLRLSVPLPQAGASLRLQAIAYDEDGLQSPRVEIALEREAPAAAAGRLLGLCVGVSRYEDPRLRIRYAASDATALAAALNGQAQGKNSLYSAVEARSLTDEEATRAAVLQALDRLAAQAGRTDTVVLFLAGHGWRGSPALERMPDAQDFFFATHEVLRQDVPGTGLPWKSVVERLAALARKSRRVVVLLDACQSGSAATNEELVRALAAANTGVMVFASSRGTEVSLESPDLGHGAFTAALLEGLAGRAVPPGESHVGLWDLATYVRHRVKELTEGKQNPQVPFLQDFDTDTPITIRPDP